MEVHNKIANALLLSSSFIENLGLLNGKMGIAIYFFHLARSSGNKIYEKYAEELIDEIYDEISTVTPLGFENGLAGIGWGIEYLAENNFIHADTNEVLEEFDDLISQEIKKTKCKMMDILGFGFYFLKRWKSVNYTSKLGLHQDRIFEDILVFLDNQKYVLVNSLKKNKSLHDIADEPYDWASLLTLWLLVELRYQKYYNDKTDKLLYYLLLSFNEINISSKNYLFKLLLWTLLKRLQSYDFNTGINQVIKATLNNIQSEDWETWGQKMQACHKNATWVWLTIAFAYQQFNYSTNDATYLEKVLFRRKKYNELLHKDISFQLDLSPSTNDFGVFEGIAGVGLLNLIISEIEKEEKQKV
jgi:hypothetical protein